MTRRNPQARVALVWWGILALCVAGGGLPFLLGLDGMEGGFAIAFICLFLGIVALIAAAIFTARARILARLLSGQELLAHWTYPQEDRRDHVDREAAEERAAGRGLFLVITVVSLLIGGGFWIADPEAGRYVLLVMVGVVAVLVVVAAVAPRSRQARRRRAEPEAFVSREGAYVLGMLHTWKLLGARVEGGQVVRGRKPVLRIKYSAPVVLGRIFFARQRFTVSIPIPPREEDRADEVLRFIVGEDGGDPS